MIRAEEDRRREGRGRLKKESSLQTRSFVHLFTPHTLFLLPEPIHLTPPPHPPLKKKISPLSPLSRNQRFSSYLQGYSFGGLITYIHMRSSHAAIQPRHSEVQIYNIFNYCVSTASFFTGNVCAFSSSFSLLQ